MASIVDSVRDVITPDVIRGIGHATGEDPTATQRALQSAIPALLGGMLSQTSTLSGAERLHALVSEGHYGAETLNSFGSMLQRGGASDSLMRSGESLVNGLYGPKADAVTESVASASGVPRSSAATLLRLAAPLVMSVIAKLVRSDHLDARGIKEMFTGDRSRIVSSLPPGLAGVLGLEEHVKTTTTHEYTRETHREPARETHHVRTKRRSAKPAVIGALAALGLLWFLSRGRDREEVVVTETPPAAERIQEAPLPQPEMPVVAAPSGRLGEIETFIVARDGNASKNFVMEDITFESGSSNLTGSGQNAVTALAVLLKKHPDVAVIIEGHTDSQGNAGANRSLSRARAENVKKALAGQGIDVKAIKVKGVGPDRPVASNDTEAGRAQNRRTEVVIVKPVRR